MKQTLIIGAGPAGISASLYLARSVKTAVTVVTNGESALAKADLIENYFGFAQPISGKKLIEDSRKNAERLGVTFVDSELVELQINMDMKFDAETADGEKNTYDSVLIATGASRTTPRIKGLKELEGKGVSYCAICDAFFYRGKPVAVIGAGEYALHEALTLSNTSSAVTVLTDGKEPSFEKNEKVSCDTRKIAEITGSGKVEAVIFEDGEKLDISGIFIAVGTAGSTALARKVGTPLDGNKIMVDENRATAVPGLFAAGDCIGGLLQVSKAVADGAIAAMSMIRFLSE